MNAFRFFALFCLFTVSVFSESIKEGQVPFTHSNATPPGELILRMPVKKVKNIRSPEIQEIIDELFATVNRENERTDPQKKGLVGLAAPQIGKNYAIILVALDVNRETKEIGNFQAFINPEIIEHSAELEENFEGCFSVDPHVIGIVKRSKDVTIRAFDRTGALITEKFSGFTARIFQHEIDHLFGIRFPDRVLEDREENLHWVEFPQIAQYRTEAKEHLERTQDQKAPFLWPIVCSRKTWKAMKMGKPYEPPVSCICHQVLDPSSNSVMQKVENIKSPEIQGIIDDLFATVNRENGRTDSQKRGLVGLAAPHIGKNYAIILVALDVNRETKEIGNFQAFINPKIIKYSPELEEDIEGSFSVDPHVIGIVKRAREITVEAIDSNGNEVIKNFSGLTARIFQHEIDLLYGINFPDRVLEDREDNLHWVEPSNLEHYRKTYRELKEKGKQASFSWPVVCPRKTWQAMKLGRPYEVPKVCTR